MNYKKSACVKALDENLDELKRRQEVESLRKFLINEKCFPPQKNPATAAITMDELKKLARAWNLNEKRNFWKSHLSKSDITAALLQYIQDNNFVVGKSDGSYSKPSAPVNSKPSKNLSMRQSLIKVVRDDQVNLVSPGQLLSNFYSNHKKIKNIRNDEDIICNSRFVQEILVGNGASTSANMFENPDRANNDGDSRVNADEGEVSSMVEFKRNHTEQSGSKARLKSKIKNRRILSRHLVRFSVEVAQESAAFPKKSAEALVQLADSKDRVTLENCTIALSNISSVPAHRVTLIEHSVLSRLSQYAQLLKIPEAVLAASLALYYFSCDGATEDTISNSSLGVIQAALFSSDPQLLLVSIFTLNNLLPCADRLRMAESLLTVFQNRFFSRNVTASFIRISQEIDERHACHHILSVLLNISSFPNTHSLLRANDVMSLLNKIATVLSFSGCGVGKEVTERDFDGYARDAHLLVSVLSNLVHQTAEYSQHYQNGEILFVFMRLLALNDSMTTADCFHLFVYMSAHPALVSAVAKEDFISYVCEYLMIASTLSPTTTANASRFLFNVSIVTVINPVVIRQAGVEKVCLKIIKLGTNSASSEVHVNALGCLLNMLTEPANRSEMVETCAEPLMAFLTTYNSVDAAHCIFNLTCSPDSVDVLVRMSVHRRLFAMISEDRRGYLLRSVIGEVLVQLSVSAQCVADLLSENLFDVLNDIVVDKALQMNPNNNGVLNVKISQLLLSAMIHHAPALTPTQQKSVIQILNNLTRTGKGVAVPDEIARNAASILVFLSREDVALSDMETVLRKSLSASQGDAVMESASVALFNLAGRPENVQLLLKEDVYLYSILHMLRTRGSAIQEPMATVLRSMCADMACTDMVLRLGLLSDLVVVALLRTSSVYLKSTFAQLFFNLLCHSAHRERLLREDTLWAMIRLTRTEVLEIRRLTLNTVFYLSSQPQFVRYLLQNSIFAFVGDLLQLGHEEFLVSCAHVLNNVYSIAASQLTVTEQISLLRACRHGLNKSVTIPVYRLVLKVCGLVLKSMDPVQAPQIVADVLNGNLVIVMQTRAGLWNSDGLCARYTSQIICILTGHENFAKTVSLAELDRLLSTVLSCASLDEDDYSVCLHVLAVMLIHARAGRVEQSEITNTSAMSWPLVNAQVIRPCDETKSDPYRVRCKQLLLSIYTYGMRQYVKTLHPGGGVPESHRLSLQTCQWMVSLVFSEVTRRIADMSRSTAGNVMSLLLMISSLDYLSAVLVKAAKDFVGLMSRLLLSSAQLDIIIAESRSAYKQHSEETVVDFCSVALRNLSSFPANLPDLVRCPGLDMLLRNLMTSPKSAVLSNLCLFFFNIAQLNFQDFKSGLVVSPQFLVMQVSSINESVDDESVTELSHRTLGYILDRHSQLLDYDSGYVQSILHELTANTALTSEDIAALRSAPRTVVNIPPVWPEFEELIVQEIEFVLELVPPPRYAWEPILDLNCASADITFQFPATVNPFQKDAVVHVEPKMMTPFRKIVRFFPLIETGVGVDHASDLSQFMEHLSAAPVAEVDSIIEDTPPDSEAALQDLDSPSRVLLKHITFENIAK